jgi:hypothetical protein
MSDQPLEDDSEHVRPDDQFHKAYGGAMMAWARLEGCLFYWFMRASGMDEPLARAIYFSARSFTGRRDMLIAAIRFSSFDDQATAVIKAGIQKARRYSEFRNQVAHREPLFDIRQGSPTWAQFVLAEGRSLDEGNDMLTIKHLGIATRNFNALTQLLWQVHPTFRTTSTDATGCLRLIRELPNQAQSTEPNQIREEL